MKINSLHPWDITPKEASAIQSRLAGKIIQKTQLKVPRLIAGADISFYNNMAYAGVVLLKFPSLETVDEFTLQDKIQFPYIPGYLSFREAPILLKLFKKISPAPQLIFFDGQGIAHPRKLGLASHMGLFLDRSTIGCAKSRLTGTHRDPGNKKGSTSPLLDEEKLVIGSVLRTREGCKPVYISVGHKVDLDTAVQWTLMTTTRYRIPEPTRRAHNLVTAYRKSMTE